MKKLMFMFSALALGVAVTSCSHPEACFSMDKESARVGETVTFTDCSTDSGMTRIYTGDGNVGVFANGKYTYEYTAAGSYKVDVSATESSDGGNSNTTSKTIVITE
ncbi:hypothetical protein [Cesiribacter sp. SM1]|uniref:PKD domain-containing protein n=1 Tax=Cesiribacter sp. SM1 TaxID=2861196 RepID=UPI001CD20D10|nr:hypothetical protein [Cesiribacter sp. SM1]